MGHPTLLNSFSPAWRIPKTQRAAAGTTVMVFAGQQCGYRRSNTFAQSLAAVISFRLKAGAGARTIPVAIANLWAGFIALQGCVLIRIRTDDALASGRPTLMVVLVFNAICV